MASSYLTRSSANSSGSGTTATISFWVRKNTEAPGDGGFFQAFTDGSNFCSVYANPTLKMRNYISGSYSSGDITCNRKLRDPAAWYHLQFVWDTTNNTAADRMRIYVNGVRETSFSSSTNPSSSYSFTPFVSGTIYVNRYNQNTTTADNNFSHFHYCDGYAYEPTSFGSTDTTTGEWKINTSPNVQYGSNGFFIFKDGSSTTDQSGNSKTFTTTGTLTNTEDCPSNNFCTMSIIDKTGQGAGMPPFSNGNTTVDTVAVAQNVGCRGTIAAKSGKYYAEAKVFGSASPEYRRLGIIGMDDPDWTTGNSYAVTTYSTGYGYKSTGDKGNNNSESSYGNTYTNGDIIGIAFDADNGAIWFSKNGTWQNSATISEIAAGTTTNAAFSSIPMTRFYTFVCTMAGATSNLGYNWNFGNGFFGTTAISSEGTNASGIGKFEYDVPTGYTALSTKGLNE
jgi:hypothetical protein